VPADGKYIFRNQHRREKKGIAKGIASASTVAAVERLSRADRRLAATVEQWDADKYLLGTPGGTIDLRTGKLRPAERSDYITKSTSVVPGGDCLRFRAFLRRIMGTDERLVSFIQRMLCYCLTADTKEHALSFCMAQARTENPCC
jgi:putative DNA primase/helicase